MISSDFSEAASIALRGRLDRSGSARLRLEIQHLATSSEKLWVLDMSAVEFIDSAGLVALVESLQVAANAQAKLVLCGLNPKARLILDITQLDRVFPIVDRIEELESFPAARIPVLACALV
jgi:anti-sigma B factor antagonist